MKNIIKNYKIKFIYVLFFIFFIIFFSFKVPDFYNYVNDYANIIDESYEYNLNNLFKVLNEESGVEIAILTISSIEDNSIEEVAVKTFEKWGIGKKGKDNGLLIILALKERKVRIEVGYGLEGDIPDIKAKDFLDEYAIPYFKDNNFNDGFYNLSIRIVKEICKINNIEFENILEKAQIENVDDIYSENEKTDLKNKDPLSIIITIIILLFIFRFFPNLIPLLFFMNIGNSGGYFGGNIKSSGYKNSGFRGGFGGFGGGRSGGGGASSSF